MPSKISPLILLCLLSFASCQNETNVGINGATQLSSSPSEIPKTFREEEKAIINVVNSIIRQMMPYAVQNSDAVNVRPQCMSAMMKTFVNIRKLKGWSLELLDSIGKPASGMLRGTSYTMGDYDECLSISVPRGGSNPATSDEVLFTGKYCHVLSQAAPAVHSMAKDYKLGKVNGSLLGNLEEVLDVVPFVPMMPEYMTQLFGICVPSVCSKDDLINIFNAFPLAGNWTVTRCEVKKVPQINYHQRFIIGIFGFLLLLVISGTLTDLLIRFAARNNSFKHDNKGKLLSIAVSFSIYSNIERFFSVNPENKASQGNCFRGLVIGSIICIIFSNTYFLPYAAFYRQAGNLRNLEQYLSQASFAPVVCLSLAVETLFISIGFLISYNYTFKSDEMRGKTRTNILKIVFYYYVRLCIPLMVCIGMLFLLPLFGSGPVWHDVIDADVAECKAGWWAYLGMYSNFQGVRKQCFSHLWIVPCLMQATLASSFITWVCSRCVRTGLVLLLIVVFGCNVAIGVLTYVNDLPPSYVPYFVANVTDEFWETSFSSPLSHFGSCGIGMILGLLITKKPDLKLSPVAILLGWILSVTILSCVILLMYFYRDQTEIATIGTAFYAALHRTCFSIGMGWIALTCILGSGGIVNTLLSSKALDPLYRMSYFAYLIHFIVITYHIGVARERFYYSHLELVLRGLSYVCATYIFAFMCHILIEMPIRSIRHSILCTTEQMVLNGFSKNGKQVEILRSVKVRVPDNKSYITSYSPNGSTGISRQ